MKDRFMTLASETLADIVGFAPASRFAPDDPIFKLLPEVKTVIGLVFRVLRGSLRGIEEGTTYYQYSAMGVETLEETIMPMALIRLSQYIEENGFIALPQRRNQQIMASEDDTDPEIYHNAIYRGVTAETQMSFPDAAVRCGLGELGLHGALLTDKFGPLVRYCFILTDAELEPTPIAKPHLCDRCGKCVEGCPGHAISADGTVDNWRCAVYYKGACGLKNPFMPRDAYSGMEDRLDIIAGEAKITREKAIKLLNETVFYPGIQHAHPASICGRACDVACYCHLEKEGRLEKTFKEPFRTRPEWSFKLEDFKIDKEGNSK